MPDPKISVAPELLELSEEDLLAQLGGELVGPQAVPMKRSELAKRAKRWLDAQHRHLEGQVCANTSIRKFATKKGSDNSAIVIELAKLLAGLVLPVNPVTLAVLLVKKGLKSFCGSSWK